VRSLTRRAAQVAALVAMLLPACGGDDTMEAARQLRRETAGDDLKITEPADGATVQGNVVDLKVEGAGIRVVAANGDTSGSTGHYHVFIDRPPVAFGRIIPQERGIVHASTSPIQLTGLTPGPHRFAVVLGDGTHRRIGRRGPTVTVNVAGPSVRADVLPETPAGQPVVLSVAVDGVSLAPPDAPVPAPTGTGHLDVFVNRDPTAPDRPVPVERGILHTADQTIAVPNLPSGEHFVWVVLVDGQHRRVDPFVADRVTVRVR
jgi:hypothetical protein